MPRAAPPKGGDLPAFPSAGQYSGTTEVFTSHRRAAPSPAPTNASAGSGQYQTRSRPANTTGDGRYGQQVAPARRAPEQSAPRPIVTTRIPSHHLNTAPRPRPQLDRPDGQYRRREYDDRPPIEAMRQVSLASDHSNDRNGSGVVAERRPVVGLQSAGRPRSPYTPPNSNFVGQPFGVVADNSTKRPAEYDPVLWNIFCQVDSDGSGQITQSELSHALINGDFSHFHADTITLMIKLFDKDRSGTISFSEFEKLWQYLLDWRAIFSRFDTDYSGFISFPEFSEALSSFGYRLSTSFAQFLFRYHDQARTKEMSFDLFVQSCVTLRIFTDVFKQFDTDQDGVITIGFEAFLRVMINNR